MEISINKGGIQCGVYAVGYFDLCGQSNEFARYVDVQVPSPNIEDDFKNILRQLTLFRSHIHGFFEGYATAKLSESAPATALPEEIAMARELESTQIKLQGFSDTVVAYVPLATTPGAVSLLPINALLTSVASTTLWSFARGFVVRGAVDVGWATEPFEGEIYGPSLLSVYELEKNALWPRAVLGPGVCEMLELHDKARPSDLRAGMNQIFARVQRSLIFRDADGQMAVDYLGTAMQAILDYEHIKLPGLIAAAQVQLETMRDKHASYSKVRRQLQSALTYFESRVGPLTLERRQYATDFFKGGQGEA